MSIEQYLLDQANLETISEQDDKIRELETEILRLREEKATTKKMGFTHDQKNNATTDWYTPQWIFDRLGLTFSLDPCAPSGGVPWIPATNHYSLSDNGLYKPWVGSVWLNPPYGKHTPDWLRKMHQHRNGIALVFARTDCKWFHEYVANADAILFMRGRVSFVDGHGKTAGGGAGCGSILVAWGDVHVCALEGVSDLGLLLKLPTDTP